MSLVTRCPKCQRGFLVVLDQLRLHDGLVRCGGCGYVFDGFATLEADLPTLTRPAPVSEVVAETAAIESTAIEPALPTQRPHAEEFDAAPAVIRYRPDSHSTSSSPSEVPQTEHGLTHEPVIADEPTLRADPAGSEHFIDDHDHELHESHSPFGTEGRVHDEPVLSASPDEALLATSPQSARRTTSEFAFDDENSPPAVVARILWALAIFASLVLLLGQLVFVFRNDIARAVPPLRPALSELCSKLKCEVGYSHRLERISIEATALQPVASSFADGQTSGFNFLFTLRNRYDQQQSWPNLVLALKDASGTVVFRKIVSPYQYLPRSLLDQPFDKGQEVNLVLPLTVAGLQISGFLLDKYFP